MTAQPISQLDPDDPGEILATLRPEFHAQFLAEYAETHARAVRPEHYPALRKMLHFWRLFAFASSQPGYDERMAAARESARTGDWGTRVPLEDIIAARQPR